MSCWPSEAIALFPVVLQIPLIVGFFVMFFLLNAFGISGGKKWRPAACIGLLSEFFAIIVVLGGRLGGQDFLYPGIHYILTLSILWLFGQKGKKIWLISGVIPILHFLAFSFLEWKM